MAPAAPNISQDVSSLRAAALLTLKAKARPRFQSSAQPGYRSPDYRQDDASSVASTRRTAPSPELNYGSDDGLADAEGSTEEEEGEKEEGEISEDEVATAVKDTRIMMDVDNEPLPGLTSSSNRIKALEEGLPEPRGPKSPSTSFPLMAKSNTGISASTSAPTITTSMLQPTSPVTASSPVPPLISAHISSPVPTPAPESGPRFRERSPMNKTISSPRASYLPGKPPTLGGPGPSSSSSSRFIPRPPSRDMNQRVSAQMPNTEQPALGKPPISPSSTVPFLTRLSQPEPSRPFVDDFHARPSLNMTAQEFAEAKAIMLDLLGWGVPSEYFINCGLTREAIYYAFSEMNLKLPSNLNAEGIVPHNPPPGYASVLSSTTPDLRPTQNEDRGFQHSASTSTMYPHGSEQSTKLTQVSATNSIIRDRRVSLPATSTQGPVKLGIVSTAAPHPLPPKPKSTISPPSSPPTLGKPQTQALLQQDLGYLGLGSSYNDHDNVADNELDQSSTSQPGPIPSLLSQSSNTAPAALPVKPSSSFPSDPPKHGYSGNLDEIETLRRQELQARKAVLASRKPKSVSVKPPARTAGPPSVSVQVPSSGTPISRPISLPRPASANSVEKPLVPPEIVDDFLKSIASGPSTSGDGDVLHCRPLTSSPDSMDMDIENTQDGPTSSGSLGAPHSSSSSLLPTTDSQLTQSQGTFPIRRSSMKRPVASDFVDYYPTPSTQESLLASATTHNGTSNGRSRGTLTSTPSFANLATTRKVVIDFSDTEDDDSMIVESGSSAQCNSYAAPMANPTLSSSASVGPFGAGSAPTPEPRPPAPAPATGMGGITPSALLAKEQEIKRMKELIAERERNRLKKLANPPKNATPPPPLPPPATSTSKPSTPPVIPPTESTVFELVPPGDVASALPFERDGSGSTTSAAGDLVEEDSIMHDIFTADPSILDMSTTSTPLSTGF